MTLTKAETKSRAYQGGQQPTDPSRVRSNTKLASLNLNWSERELRERVRTKHVHRLHPYLGKYIPQLVEVFLRKYFKAGQTIVDPFCGSGTTLVQANELGINSIGYDVSAFNVLLTRVKSAEYDVVKARREIADVLHKAKNVFQSRGQTSLFAAESKVVYDAGNVDMEYLERWFAPKTLSQLLIYLSLIKNEGYQYHDLLKVILCRSARSARLTTHFDLDFPKVPQTKAYWCYKHSRECFPTDEAMKFLERYSIDTVKRIEEFARLRSRASVKVFHDDSRRAKIPPHNGVVTSPPYVGLIDYHQQHVYAYALLGLHDKREDEIGAASNGSGLKSKATYQKDIVEVFARVFDDLLPQGRVIVVANDKAGLYDQIAAELGVETEAVVQRHVNRRTGRRSSDFFESIFIWRARSRSKRKSTKTLTRGISHG